MENTSKIYHYANLRDVMKRVAHYEQSQWELYTDKSEQTFGEFCAKAAVVSGTSEALSRWDAKGKTRIAFPILGQVQEGPLKQRDAVLNAIWDISTARQLQRVGSPKSAPNLIVLDLHGGANQLLN